MEDVLVIGAGPAGAACSLSLHQLGMKVLVLERTRTPRDLLRRPAEADRWSSATPATAGKALAARLHIQLCLSEVPHRLGFDALSVRSGGAQGGWVVGDASSTVRARYVVIATGTRPRRGGFSDSACVGIGPGHSMERIPVRGRRVAILGGGDNAFDQATFALGRGADSVDVYCRQLPRAQPLLQLDVPAQCVHIGPFEVDPARMSVNGSRYDVIGVQFGFEACVPAGLRLPLRDGRIDVDGRGEVPGFRGLFAAGEVANFWHPCVSSAFAQGDQVARAIRFDHLSTGLSAQASKVAAAA